MQFIGVRQDAEAVLAKDVMDFVADNPIYRRWLGQFVYPLGVELDITIQNQQVRASLTACAVTLLANVVNRNLLL
ncbi:hypothetical protein CF123_09460 [Aeromonas veronii]|uniref:Uncharacterized protein n=1 Tax=Aeromonas veronii TaxID=654 RepID=A0AAX2UV35_AERVE|nr:hypothetical protein CF123_09460 [Aeromonas veronii]